MDLYGLSKMLQVMYTEELSRRLEAKGVKNIFIGSAHPGWVFTDAINKSKQDLLVLRIIGLVAPYMKIQPEQGTLSPLFLATAPDSQVSQFRGRVIDQGPWIKPLSITNKDYTPKNARKVYDDIHMIIQSTGFRVNEI